MPRNLTNYRRKYLALKVTEARRNLKAKAVQYKGGKCSRCKCTGVPAIFDFHHPDPLAKDFQISGSYKSFERLRPELDKTQMLCSNCHRTVHEEWFASSFVLRKEELKKEAPTSW